MSLALFSLDKLFIFKKYRWKQSRRLLTIIKITVSVEDSFWWFKRNIIRPKTESNSFFYTTESIINGVKVEKNNWQHLLPPKIKVSIFRYRQFLPYDGCFLPNDIEVLNISMYFLILLCLFFKGKWIDLVDNVRKGKSHRRQLIEHCHTARFKLETPR